ncbi:polysaccharide pyruvyl transferase family protein [Georgenia faecalis]|uniref:Polysaccharide pyruvyl transferase family protein n=1 Tax=Georgenia faecalis TaxID=2483799 RepID=A0ABV9D540_9MICO|nr:polysaccharide pyruvyl transferase family protein [Georgenia faecalis]
MNITDLHYLSTLRTATETILREALGEAPKPIALLDAPRHRNLGDSLIWLGELQYLTSLGHEIVYTADIGRFFSDDIARLPADTVLVLHGGGNFGDLYPAHDSFRRHIVEAHGDRRIVVMPQSIHYQDHETLRHAGAAYSRAADLTLLVRENRSLDIAKENFQGVDVRYCYDAALGAPIEDTKSSARDGILTLARGDQEALPADLSLARTAGMRDWEFTPLNSAAWKGAIAVGAAYKRLPGMARRPFYRANLAALDYCLRLNVSAALHQFSGRSAVATNRLHAHILAALLGIPHAVADNSYGKVSSIYEEYTGAFSTAHLVDSLSEAVTTANDLSRAGSR